MAKKILFFVLILAVLALAIPLICHCCLMHPSTNSAQPSIDQKMPSCCSGTMSVMKDCGSVLRKEISGIIQVLSHPFAPHYHFNQTIQSAKPSEFGSVEISPPLAAPVPLYLTLQTLRI